jgi:hypothetical protein
MRRNVTDFENLSAALDDELPSSEKQALLQKAAQSDLLREELAGLRMVKDAVTSLEPLRENPLFETRLRERLEENAERSPWSVAAKPAVAFAAVAVALMISLRVSPEFFPNLFEEQRARIASIYERNLRPILAYNGFTNDDVFNFAFNNVIPLDREKNRGLALEANQAGFFTLESRDVGAERAGMDRREFAAAFELDDRELSALDSILESYSNDLASSILVGEEPGAYVNAGLPATRAALQADILCFARDANPDAYRRVFRDVEFAEDPETSFRSLIEREQKRDRDNYFYVNDDSVYRVSLSVDVDSLLRDVRANAGKPRPNGDPFGPRFASSAPPDPYDSIFHQRWRVFVDSSRFRARVPRAPAPPAIFFPTRAWNHDNAFVALDSAMDQLNSVRVNVQVLSDNAGSFHVEVSFPDSATPRQFEYRYEIRGDFRPDGGGFVHYGDDTFRVPAPDIDSILFASGFPDVDSIFDASPFMSDSAFFGPDARFPFAGGFGSSEELREEMEDVRREVERMRKEIEVIKKEIREQ